MHSCLLVDEILKRILGHSDTRALYNVSLVCRAFSEPANDELWAELPGLAPLVMCLPNSLLRASNPSFYALLTIVRPPLPSEWHRFDHHARRVKRITVPDPEELDSNALEILTARHPGPILPRVQYLTWQNWDLAEFAPFFITPTLVYLEFEPAEEAVCAVLKRVQTSAPQLQWLALGTLDHQLQGSDDHAVFTETLLSLNHLVGLDWSHVPLQSKALAHLSRLPLFASLSLFLLNHDKKPWTSSGWGGFPALKSLSLMPDERNDVAIPCAPFLRALSGANLTNLRVKIPPTVRPGEFAELVSAIGHLRRLVSLDIQFDQVDVDPWGAVIIDGRALSPLYAIQGIQSFKMARAPTRLDPQSIRELASAWRNINTLVLTPPSPARCYMHLSDFIAFTRTFHMLTRLTIEVRLVDESDACELSAELFWPPSPLLDLHLCETRIARPAEAQVADYLARIFPFARLHHTLDIASWRMREAAAEYIEAAAVLDNVDRLKQELKKGVLARVSAAMQERTVDTSRSGGRTDFSIV
ncbi:F-box protein [Phanerochaete sordida]|uniref:F-box protein n=1 Tax=Phanerochaete sordida TaxID=48140 RepID=A0A9P3GLW8_9APHY|nr:F-box protein [Phanerochaete sordida]